MPTDLPITDNLDLHLRAEDVVAADGATFTDWPDASAAANDFDTGAFAPSTGGRLRDNLLNGLPAVELDHNDTLGAFTGGDILKYTGAFTVYCVFRTIPTTTAEVVKQFSFNAGLEDWGFLAGGGTNLTGTRDTTEDSPNDTNAGTGVLQTRRTGKNQTDGTPLWDWDGSWETLGVPGGAIVKSVKLDFDWRCPEYSTGAASTIGPANFFGSGSGEFSAEASFAATTDWATRAGATIPVNQESFETVTFRIFGNPKTGNSNSAAVAIRVDWVVVTVTYELQSPLADQYLLTKSHDTASQLCYEIRARPAGADRFSVVARVAGTNQTKTSDDLTVTEWTVYATVVDPADVVSFFQGDQAKGDISIFDPAGAINNNTRAVWIGARNAGASAINNNSRFQLAELAVYNVEHTASERGQIVGDRLAKYGLGPLLASASGAATSAGSADATVPTLFADASGASVTGGSAAVAGVPPQASGASVTAGDAAALIPILLASASGSVVTSGSGEGTIPLPVSASGGSVTGGSADASRLIPLTATATIYLTVANATLESRTPLEPWDEDESQKTRITLQMRGDLLVAVPVVAAPKGEVYVRRSRQVFPAPVLDANARPDAALWVPGVVDYSDWGRLQVIVGGQDVTFFRDAPTQVGNWSKTEPFDDAIAVISLPQLTPFEALGAGALGWLYDGAPVELHMVRPAGTTKKLWSGLVASIDDSREAVELQCVGDLYQLDFFLRPPVFTETPKDIGLIIADLINERYDNGTYRGGPANRVATGIRVRQRGAWEPLLTGYIGELLGQAQGVLRKDPVVAIAATSADDGYWLVASDGLLLTFGAASSFGTVDPETLAGAIVGMAVTPTGAGYWLVGADGGVFAFGDAVFFGSMAETPLNAPIVGMAPTATGAGYWLVGADGGVFAFGDAVFFGGLAGTPLNAPIVGMAPTPTDAGYWLVGADGGVFTFGDAVFYGGLADTPLNKPVVGMAPTATGAGYWLVAADGGVFAFGNAVFYGSMGSTALDMAVSGIAVTSTAAGYWVGAQDAGVFAFGDATFFGSLADVDGDQWTLMKEGRNARLKFKNRRTRHWEIRAGQPGVTHRLARDVTQISNAIFGEGVDQENCWWRNSRYPNLRPDDAPVFDGNLIRPGAVSVAWQNFATEGIRNGWGFNSDTRYERFEVGIVRAFQVARGLQVDGIVGPQTWAAMFDVGSNGGDLSGAYFAPLVIEPEVEPFLYTGNGAVAGPNPAFDPGVLRVERHINFGSRVSKAEGIESARLQLERDADAVYFGTITLEVDPTDLTGAARSRYEIQAGENLVLQNHRGVDRLFHIAGVEVSFPDRVELTVDEKARDLMTLAAIRERERETHDPVRRKRETRSTSRIQEDRIAVWDCESGAGIIPRHGTFRKLWNVLRIPAGSRGQITRAEFQTDTPSRFSIAVFDRPTSHIELRREIPDPLAENAWKNFPEDRGLLIAWGGNENAGGFYPGFETDGDPITGRLVDNASWYYESTVSPWLFVAIWVEEPAVNFISGRLHPGIEG